MDEETHVPGSPEETKETKDERIYLIPAAIIIAGIIIAGAVMYSFSPAGFRIIGEKTGGERTAFDFTELAGALGLDVKQFSDCISSRKYQDEVAKDYEDGVQAGVDGTPAFFINGAKVSGAQPFSVFKAAIDGVKQTQTPAEKASIENGADDDPVLGNPNAPVTIIEFGDFQCPYCKKFHDDTFPMLKKTYIDTGKAKFVYRDFPLENIHPNARPAAEAAECADDQGKFWEYHNALYRDQSALFDTSSANNSK